MQVVGLKLLRKKLAEYVRLAAGGERILVTDRDRVVAELIPPQSGTVEFGRDAQLAEAVRKGWVRPTVAPQTGPPPQMLVAPFADLMRELDADRANR